MRHSTPLATVVVAMALALSGCASSLTGDSYSRGEARTAQSVSLGTIVGIRAVKIEGTQSGVGTVGGAALGGLAGSTIGGGRGAIAGAIAGVIGGGLLGSAAEQGVTGRQGIEITVREDNGLTRAYVQEQDNEMFRVGDRVRVLNVNGTSRVAH